MGLKTSIPLLITQYIMSGIMVVLLCLDGNTIPDFVSNILYVVFFVLVFISFILMILHLLFAVKDNKKVTRKTLVANFVFQLLLLPNTLFAFFIMVCFLATGTFFAFSIFFLATIPVIFVAFLVFVYQTTIIFVSSAYTVVFLWKRKEEDNIFALLIHMVLQCFFLTNVADSIFLLRHYKKEDQSSVLSL